MNRDFLKVSRNTSADLIDFMASTRRKVLYMQGKLEILGAWVVIPKQLFWPKQCSMSKELLLGFFQGISPK